MALSLMALVLTTTAFAQDAKLKRLETSEQGRGWDAVGRLDIGGEGFCTGSLIAPDLVLTAAHCLYDKQTGQRINHENIEFLAGWRNGRASAYRNVRRAVVHPDYVFGKDLSSGRVRNDVALLEIRRPIRDTVIMPFGTGTRPRKGDLVGVVSYAKDRSEAPSLQEVCEVLAQQDGVLVTTCTVDFGSSGAPIFIFNDGQAHVVSVISAKAESDGQNVALGTALSAPLEVLKAQLIAGEGFLTSSDGAVRRIAVGGQRTNTGAKFVKP
ncbi:MAG: trypsin-like serine protease [Aliishimia sp.]